MRSDAGKEFENKTLSEYLKSVKVHHIVTRNETKANYAERVIKTLKHKLFRYMMKKRTQRYIDVLQDIVNSYNHTVHRGLGRKPASITKANEGESRLQQYLLRRPEKKPSKKRKYGFKIGQTVRISHLRSLFDREYSQKWTGEVFSVAKRYRREGIPIYTLVDWDDERVEGTFYEQELQATYVDSSTEYRIEKILKKRTKNKKKEVLVRWLHWPKKYDSWIPETNVNDYS